MLRCTSFLKIKFVSGLRQKDPHERKPPYRSHTRTHTLNFAVHTCCEAHDSSPAINIIDSPMSSIYFTWILRKTATLTPSLYQVIN